MPPASIHEVGGFNVKGLDMSNVKVRKAGWYLFKENEGDEVEVGYLSKCYKDEEMLLVGTDLGWQLHEFYWISEYPLNLGQLAINDGYNAAIIKKVQDEFGVKIGEEGGDVI